LQTVKTAAQQVSYKPVNYIILDDTLMHKHNANAFNFKTKN